MARDAEGEGNTAVSDAKVEVYRLKSEADEAIERHRRRGLPNILVMGSLELIEGATDADQGWLVVATDADVLAAGSSS